MAKRKNHYFDSDEAQVLYKKWQQKDADAGNALALMLHEIVVRFVNKNFKNINSDKENFEELCQQVNAHLWTALIDGKYSTSKGLLFNWATSVINNRIRDIRRAPNRGIVSIHGLENAIPSIRDTTELVEANEEFHRMVLKVQGAFLMYLPKKCVMELMTEVIDHKYRLNLKLERSVSAVLRSNRVKLRGMNMLTFTQYLVILVRSQALNYEQPAQTSAEGVTLTRILEIAIGIGPARHVMDLIAGMTIMVPDPVRKKRIKRMTGAR